MLKGLGKIFFPFNFQYEFKSFVDWVHIENN